MFGNHSPSDRLTELFGGSNEEPLGSDPFEPFKKYNFNSHPASPPIGSCEVLARAHHCLDFYLGRKYFLKNQVGPFHVIVAGDQENAFCISFLGKSESVVCVFDSTSRDWVNFNVS